MFNLKQLSYCALSTTSFFCISFFSFIITSESSAQETIYITDELVLDEDICYSNTIFKFNQGAVLEIKDGAQVKFIDGCRLEGDGNQVNWEGIVIYDNSELWIHDSEVNDAQDGIQTSLAKLSLINAIIDYDDGQSYGNNGMIITGPVEFLDFKGNNIMGYDRGITIDNENDFYTYYLEGEDPYYNANRIVAKSIGMLIINARVKLRFNYIKGDQVGLWVQDSKYCNLIKNGLDGGIGLLGFESTTYIIGNGINFGNFGAVGVYLRGSTPPSHIFTNEIGGKKFALQMLDCHNISVEDNEFDLDQTDPPYAFNPKAAIQIRGSTGNTFFNNNINVRDAESGIHSIASSNNTYLNNTIRIADYEDDNDGVPVRLNASVLEMVVENKMWCKDGGHGVQMLNSTDTDVYCNYIYAPLGRGIENLTNSNMQDLAGNELIANLDLYINSDLGKQKHRGNHFIGFPVPNGGSVLAEGLSPTELLNSQFELEPLPADGYDPEKYWPKNLLTDNWFAPLDGNTFEECTENPGADWTPIHQGPPTYPVQDPPDDDETCSEADMIVLLKGVNNRSYFTRAFHLLRVLLQFDSLTELPDCVDVLLNDPDLCALVQLVQVQTTVEQALGHVDSDTYPIIDELTLASDNYEGSRSAADKVILEQKQAQWQLIFDQIHTNRQVVFNQQETILNGIDCMDSHIQRWKYALESYIHNLKDTNVPGTAPKNASFIVEEANLCADTHGDPVHIFRGIMSDFDDSQTVHLDNCRNLTPRSSTPKMIIQSNLIQPNPNTGYFNLSVPDQNQTYKIAVFDIQGRIIYTSSFIPGDGVKSISLEGESDGYYLVKLVNESGYIYQDKFIINH